MYISRKYTVEDWRAIDFTSEEDWQTAISIFEDRIETRYLEHIRSLLNRRTSGFVVLTLDCALIETLEQFRKGTPETPWREVEKYFVSFLTTTAFRRHFDASTAKLFYKTIRCGLLHQAETQGGSRINLGRDRPLVAYAPDRTGVVINKRKFHALLEEVVREYVVDLRAGQSTELRNKFRQKMNHICRCES